MMGVEEVFEAAGPYAGIGIAAMIVAAARFFGRRKCPKCAARGTLAHVYERNGRPDRRFKHNPLLCLKCRAQFVDDAS